MSSSKDRVAVPTNGHQPPLPDDAPGSSLAPAASSGDAGTPIEPTMRSNPTMGLPASPAQLAVGFGIVAALIVLLLGRRRRR